MDNINVEHNDYVTKTYNMHAFQIKFLVQFFASSTCFEHIVFVIRKTLCAGIVYGMFFLLSLQKRLYRIPKCKRLRS